MKTLILLLVALTLVSGCTSTTVVTPTWRLSRISVMQKADIGLAEIATNGVVRLKGYKASGDAEMAAMIAEAAVRGAVKP